MQIIPVIDLYNAQVVHARAGDRKHYQPVCSPLCQSAEAIDVITAYLGLANFPVLYIADLNAIKNEGDNALLIKQIAQDFPNMEIWLDAGRNFAPMRLTSSSIRQVIGTESFKNKNELQQQQSSRSILSLDYINNQLIGDESLLNDMSLWPEDVIVMTLNRVGSLQGPDLNQLKLLLSRANGHRIFAAGGVRNEADVRELANLDLSGVLIATALHELTLSKTCLDKHTS